jgi:hypothetical protein
MSANISWDTTNKTNSTGEGRVKDRKVGGDWNPSGVGEGYFRE